jgi:hypothetical protein
MGVAQHQGLALGRCVEWSDALFEGSFPQPICPQCARAHPLEQRSFPGPDMVAARRLGPVHRDQANTDIHGQMMSGMRS